MATWHEIADLLAARMYHQSHGGCHPESEADPDNCPTCADRAAYRAWEAKSCRTHAPEPYRGPVLNVFEHGRSNGHSLT